MAKTWKTVAANEITKLEESKVTLKRQPDGRWQVRGDLDALAEPQTFDAFIARTEQEIAPYLTTTGPVERLSAVWHARELRDQIVGVRMLIKARKPSQVAIKATELGIAIMQAYASSQWNEPLKKARKAVRDQRGASRVGVEKRTARTEFHDRIDELRKSDPDITAADMARKLDADFGNRDDYPDTIQRRRNLAATVRRYLKRKR